MSENLENLPQSPPDFRRSRGRSPYRFFQRGLAAILPTLITFLLVVKIWELLWENIGQYIIWLMKLTHAQVERRRGRPDAISHVANFWNHELPYWLVQALGVLLAIILIYIVGLFVGNLLGRTAWRLMETGVMRIPLIRAIYPAVKQVTDFVLAERKGHWEGARVVAVRPHTDNIWSIGLVTGSGIRSLSDALGMEMVTVFIPSSPTSFSGYVLVVPRDRVLEMPMTVEQAMRLLITGGVGTPLEHQGNAQAARQAPAASPGQNPTGALASGPAGPGAVA